MSKPFVLLKSRKVLISVGIVAIVVVIGTILMGSFSTTTSAAPNFQLRTIEGNRILLTSFRGKPLRLFMAACRTCIDQSEAITKVKSEFGNNVDLLVIDMWTILAIGGDSAYGK